MKPKTLQELQQRFKELGYTWPTFHIIGIRSNEDKPDAFDDLIYVVNGGRLYCYTCTTNPGKYYLENPMNAKGAGVLKPGQYIDAFGFGFHNGQYECLVQVKPLTVYRDSDKDLHSEEDGAEDTGMFYIQIHRANDKTTSVLIGKWSAACQVLNNPKMWVEFLQLCKDSKLQRFTYTLLKEW